MVNTKKKKGIKKISSQKQKQKQQRTTNKQQNKARKRKNRLTLQLPVFFLLFECAFE